MSFYSFTQTAAIPMPVPTHMLVTPTRPPVRSSSLRIVET